MMAADVGSHGGVNQRRQPGTLLDNFIVAKLQLWNDSQSHPPTQFPAQQGLAGSALTADQRALVRTAILQWVRDLPSAPEFDG